MIDNLLVFFLPSLVGRWPPRHVLQQPALQLPAISKYRVKIIFWVLEDGARRPPSYYDMPCPFLNYELYKAKPIMNYFITSNVLPSAANTVLGKMARASFSNSSSSS